MFTTRWSKEMLGEDQFAIDLVSLLIDSSALSNASFKLSEKKIDFILKNVAFHVVD